MPMMQVSRMGAVTGLLSGMPSFLDSRLDLAKQEDYRDHRKCTQADQYIVELADRAADSR
jgi:hypothetical protein